MREIIFFKSSNLVTNIFSSSHNVFKNSLSLLGQKLFMCIKELMTVRYKAVENIVIQGENAGNQKN